MCSTQTDTQMGAASPQILTKSGLGFGDSKNSASIRPERLVICVDSSVAHGNDVKRRIYNFLELKSKVNDHEFAVMIIKNGEVEWLCGFTPDIRMVTNCVRGLMYPDFRYICHKPTEFEMSKLFEELLHHWEKSRKMEDFSLRLIIFYSRVNCLPITESDFALSKLYKKYSITVDVVYMIQSPKAGDNSLQQKKIHEIFRSLCALTGPNSYCFPIENFKQLTLCTTRLLAHPFFRDSQANDWVKINV